MADGEGVGAIGAEGFWRLDPRVIGQMEEDSPFVIFFLACFAFSNRAAFNKGARSDDALRSISDEQ